MHNGQWAIGNGQSQRAFTLVEILVAVGVMAILGTALVGLMSAAVDAWRRGEADRQVHEKLQALQRQLADDLAAAVLDPPPVPDFHYVLDTLWDLPDPADPYYPILSGASLLKTDQSPGHDARYFAPDGDTPATVELRIRVPFVMGAALLHARFDGLHSDAKVTLHVARNDPASATPDQPLGWQLLETRTGECISGGEYVISEWVRNGDIVFVRATLESTKAETAQFLRGDRLRSEGRPVLLLDCYRDPNAVPLRLRPTFQAWYENGAQVVSWVRTIPGETEKAALRAAGNPSGTEYLNYFDDNGDQQVDEPANLKPLGGRGRVVYRFEPGPKPGLGILRRGFEAPVDRPIQQVPTHDFLTNVLHFSLTFWGADTTVWETHPELEEGYDTKYDGTNRPHPPSERWLSARYLPEQVQVTVVLEPERGRHFSVGLRADLDADYPTSDRGALQVTSTQGFPSSNHPQDFVHDFLRDPRHFVKIEDEWLYYERADDRPHALVVPSTGRGARNTAKAVHLAGAEVWRGRPFVFTLQVPAFRHWQR